MAGILARVRRTGITESTLGEIFDETRRIADAAAVSVPSTASVGVKEFLNSSDHTCHPRIMGMSLAAEELMNSGIIAMEGELGIKNGYGMGIAIVRGDRSGKVRLRIAAEDVRAAYKDDADAKVLGLGSDL